jgi:hypothetical protein
VVSQIRGCSDTAFCSILVLRYDDKSCTFLPLGRHAYTPMVMSSPRPQSVREERPSFMLVPERYYPILSKENSRNLELYTAHT